MYKISLLQNGTEGSFRDSFRMKNSSRLYNLEEFSTSDDAIWLLILWRCLGWPVLLTRPKINGKQVESWWSCPLICVFIKIIRFSIKYTIIWLTCYCMLIILFILFCQLSQYILCTEYSNWKWIVQYENISLSNLWQWDCRTIYSTIWLLALQKRLRVVWGFKFSLKASWKPWTFSKAYPSFENTLFTIQEGVNFCQYHSDSFSYTSFTSFSLWRIKKTQQKRWSA